MQVLWMVVGAFLFATMGMCIKYAAPYFNTAEIVFYRGLIGMLVLWLLSASQGVSLKTAHPWMHTWRSLVGVTAMGCWFYAITQMPLASAMTLN
ncbi:MAG: EamA family transporter, partial [Comamonas sp.]|nr:EamA family transporter [Comamonas sp.]